MQSKCSVMLRVDLRPVTVVRETTIGQVRHRNLWEQRKLSGSLLECSVPLTKKLQNLRSFLKEKSGRWLKILEMLESELSKLQKTIHPTQLSVGMYSSYSNYVIPPLNLNFNQTTIILSSWLFKQNKQFKNHEVKDVVKIHENGFTCSPIKWYYTPFFSKNPVW